MKFEINFLDNLKEFGIFIFALLLVFPVNILISNDNQISIRFVIAYDYAYITRENMYLAIPCSFILLPFFKPINTKPTGFSIVPPLGPAMPVTETEIFVLLILFKFLTIDKQVS